VAKRKVLNLNAVVAECITSSEVDRIKAYHPEIEIEVNLDKELRNIEGFSLHLSKTLTNLVSNAAESIHGGGKIRIETSNSRIADHEEIEAGEYAVLRISDNGVGITEVEKEKIFEPFFTKKEMGRSGTGLGMTIVWNSVKDHNGYIALDSRKGVGTTFSLYFPVTDKALTLEKVDSSLPMVTGNGESVLVVDDVEEQREIARDVLSRLGYRVTIKASGEEAMAFIEQNETDLVILDMIMEQGMDGLDTYRKILELYPNQKAVLTSGFGETDRLREALRLGGGAYVKKPYLVETIARAVREELSKQPSKRKVG
jgi:CheY-like chemotaxis protein